MRILVALGAALFALAPDSSYSDATHPLDALDASEIAQSVALLRAKGHAGPETPILSLTLDPPPKADVIAWKSGRSFSRRSVATIRTNRKTQEIVIDLVSGEITSIVEIPGPGQPPIVLPELFGAIEIALNSEKMQAGLAKRGVTNLDAVFCVPRTSGNFGELVEQERRLAKVDCFDLQNNPSN
jgi:primary-amine oxidase